MNSFCKTRWAAEPAGDMDTSSKLRCSLAPFDATVDSQDLRREWKEWLRAFELEMEMQNVFTQHEKFVRLLSFGGSGNCVGVGTHSHVWDCGSPRYTRALPVDTHWTRAEHLAVRPRSSTRRKLSSLTAVYGRRSQFTCPAHVVEPRGEPAKHDLTAAYLAGRRRPLQAHVAESYQPAIAEHPRGKSHALQEYDTFAPAVHRPEKPRAQRGRTLIAERGEQIITTATCGLPNTVRETQLADQPAATCGLRRESRREVADLSQYGPETVLARFWIEHQDGLVGEDCRAGGRREGEYEGKVDNPDQVRLDRCDLIEQVMIGEDTLLRFSGVLLGEACTVVIRGATQLIFAEADRSLHDALCALAAETFGKESMAMEEHE
ncbi:chaperonin [Culex quinquefasciatus]|uniref:Chaperonin n=1 Tax=Culex quinquefasciatus TaxID=7176 RepID=B0X1B1_CULQU|nr:chaperonin [Culex quinquefasciatus]|eukprot:XP_001863433.1 chaperonin [Culex quinquefasciatus]